MFLTETQIAAASDLLLLTVLEDLQRTLQAAEWPNPVYMAVRDRMVAECDRRGLV